MSKKVFIVSSTMRKNGNSELLADEFAKGAAAAGNEVDKISLRDIQLKFCIGCLACQKSGKCVHNDGMTEIYSRVQNADVLVFATPVYYYEMSGQLKTFIDRLNPLFLKSNTFKKVYLLASSADTSKSAMEGAIKGVQGFIDCFEGVSLGGVVYGVGAEAAGDIKNTPAMKQAYEMGKNV